MHVHVHYTKHASVQCILGTKSMCVCVVCSRLVQRWVDYMLGALVTAGRDLQEKVTPLLDNLTCQLLALCEYISVCLYTIDV